MSDRIIDVSCASGSLETGYTVVFVIAIVLARIAAFGMAFLVQEPRTGRVYVIKALTRP